MAAQQTTAGIIARLGDRAARAWDQSKAEEIRYGLQNLPSGIAGGIARLVTVKVDEYKNGDLQGQPGVFFRSIVATPVDHKGVRCAGQGAMINIPLCDTPNKSLNGAPGTLEGWIAELTNELKKLGVAVDTTGVQHLEAILASLEKTRPWHRFSTRGWTPPKRKPTDPEPTEMVFTQFDGLCDPPAEGADEAPPTADELPRTPVNRVAGHLNNGPPPSPTGQPRPQATTAPVEPPPANGYRDDADLPSLARRADALDQEAIDQLNELALGTGLAQKKIDDAPSWTAVVEMMNSGGGAPAKGKGAKAKAASEPAEWRPTAGEVYMYRPVNKGRKAAKAVEAEVTEVNPADKTVVVKLLDDPTKKYTAGWGDLEQGD